MLRRECLSDLVELGRDFDEARHHSSGATSSKLTGAATGVGVRRVGPGGGSATDGGHAARQKYVPHFCQKMRHLTASVDLLVRRRLARRPRPTGLFRWDGDLDNSHACISRVRLGRNAMGQVSAFGRFSLWAVIGLGSDD